jgi:hypothetical protein
MEITEWIHIQGLPNTSVTMNLWFEKKKKNSIYKLSILNLQGNFAPPVTPPRKPC